MSSSRTCDDCLYGDKCSSHLTCKYFVPLDPAESNDDTIFEYIEEERREYAEAFMRYWQISEYGEKDHQTGRDRFGETINLSEVHI